MGGNILIIDDSSIERKIIGQAIKKKLKDVNIFEELERNSGSQFDPKLVSVFIKKVLS